MSGPYGVVYLLDDEPGMIKALTRLLRAERYEVRGFISVREFLAAPPEDGSSCLVLDVAMPELDGMELQRRLAARGYGIPIVFLTGHGDIPMSVRAIKDGAIDFLTKPVDAQALLAAVRAALAVSVDRQRSAGETAAWSQRYETLTPREKEVMAHVVTGQLNKQIAADLGTGEQNIKVHRARVMEKMQVDSVAELVRIADRLRKRPSSTSGHPNDTHRKSRLTSVRCG